MIRPGLTFKLSVLLACIGVLASGATGYYAYHANRTMLVKEAGRSLMTSTELLGERFSASVDDVGADALVLEGALATARTQIVVSKLALSAAERMFEAGGASATARAHNFDRHWRNLRTIFSHNPLMHKARVIGDYALNGVTTHLTEGRVF